MTLRARSGLVVSALIRRVAQDGGTAALLARGDDEAGGIVVVRAERGEITGLIERGYGLNDKPVWRDIAPQVVGATMALGDYIERRRSVDRDLWIVELDIAESERFAALLASIG